MTLEPAFTLGISLLGSAINLNSILSCLDDIVAELPS
jgi:hypothetical protein